MSKDIREDLRRLFESNGIYGDGEDILDAVADLQDRAARRAVSTKGKKANDRRFQAAVAAMSAMIGRVPWGETHKVDPKDLTQSAVDFADKLLAALGGSDD